MLNAGLVDVRAAVEGEDLGIGESLRGIAERGDLVVAVRHDPPVEERHRLALADALAVDGRVTDSARHLDAVRALRDLGHRARDLGGRSSRIEGDERGHALRDVAGRDDPNLHLRDLRGLLGGEDHVAVVGKDDDGLRVRGADRGQELLGRRIHGRAAAERGRAERARDLREPLARDDRDDTNFSRRHARRRSHHDPGRALVLGGHRVQVLDDDVADPARGEADADDLVGLKRVHVDLHQGLVADDEHAIGSELQHLLADLSDRPRWRLDEELNVVGPFP